VPQVILDFDGPTGARIAAAFGKVRGLRDAQGVARSATLPEMKLELIQYLKNVTLDQERQAAKQVAEDALVGSDVVIG